MTSDFCKTLIKFGDRWLAPFLLLISLLGSAAFGLEIYRLPGELSANRLMMISIPAITGLAALAGLIWTYRNTSRMEKQLSQIIANGRLSKKVEIILPVIWFVLFIIAFLPMSSLGRWGAVYVRLCPILQLVFLIASEIWIYWLYQTRKAQITCAQGSKAAVMAGLIFAACLILIILIISLTGKGIGIGTNFWGKSGVPVVHWQWLGAWSVMVVWLWMDGKSKERVAPWLKDVILFVALWITAFVIWQSVPETISRYVTAAYPPNYAHYPYSDAGEYAIEAEAIGVGNGFPYGFIDKPLHLTFLYALSLLTGSDYAKMITLQVGILAVIPGLIYLIASKIFSRSAGLLAGLVVLFMQSNNLAIANRVQATNVKMAMAESLTGMLLMVFCLALIAWWKKPDNKFIRPALAGALLGLAGMVRMNALVIIPFVFLTFLLAFGWKKQKSWLMALVFVVFCVVPFIPWGVRSQIVLHNPIEFIFSKAEGVLLRGRYYPITNDVVEPPAEDSQTDMVVGPNQPPPKTVGVLGLIEPMLHSGFHNLIAVAFVLPANSTHFGLDQTIRLPYWDQEWDGAFPVGGQIVFAVSLLVVVIGFSGGWKRSHVVSLIPLVVLLPYLLSNTVSLVSGGRYIVPVDWVLPLYYSIGIACVTGWVLKISPLQNTIVDLQGGEKSGRSRSNIWLWIALGLTLIISLIPMILSLSIPKQFVPTSAVQVLGEIKTTSANLPTNFTWEELEKFSADKDAAFISGRAMFPRWMKSGEGDTAGTGSAFSALPFDHLSFSLISDEMYPFDGVLPISKPVEYLPNASDVILVGCQTDVYFDAALVIVKAAEPVVYARPDIKELTCPLPQP
jgi:hypothetical protein